MKIKKFEIELLKDALAVGRSEAYEKVLMYLLQRYCKGCEEFECFDIFEGINRGTGRKGLLNTSSEGRRDKERN